jgi:hypothetical protein
MSNDGTWLQIARIESGASDPKARAREVPFGIADEEHPRDPSTHKPKQNSPALARSRSGFGGVGCHPFGPFCDLHEFTTDNLECLFSSLP